MAKGEYAAQVLLVKLLSRRKKPTAKQVVRSLRPPELTYLCDLCAELEALGLCDDRFLEDEEEDEDAEESD